MTETTETNRDRVRRLLIGPTGFRHPVSGPKRLDPAEARAWLDTLADDLAYMPDDRLTALAEALRGKGEGASRDFWPSRAAVLGHAEWLCPRPLALAPALLRWFASVEGPRAIAEGTLVETWAFFERHKVPPVKPLARAEIAHLSADNARRLELIADRRRRQVANSPADEAWERGYLERRALCEQAVTAARAGRDAA